MDFLHNLAVGFDTSLTPLNLLYCFIGTVIGTFIGVLPGIGPTATIAMLMPLTFSLPPTTGLIMLAGIFYGSQYGGSITAILINLPGEATSAVTAIDGYKMAQRGRAGPALAISAIGSFVAGTIATLIIGLFAVPLTDAAIRFRPPEYVSLIALGLILAASLAQGSKLKALAMVIFGLLLGLIGTDVYTDKQRFTFGLMDLADGIDIVAIAIGLFGIPEILRHLEDESDRHVIAKKISNLMPSAAEFRQSAGPILRGTAIGSVLGILPGGGALLSSFASYTAEKRLAADPSRFGNGAIEGVAGPEAANNAGAQTSFIPMLALGIPSNAVMALMISAMIVQGIVPGPNLVTQKPDLFWGLVTSMWIGNFMLLILNLPLVGLWVRFLTIPYWILFPAIIVFSAVGIFTLENKPSDVYLICIFGLLGYALAKLECEPAPLLLGFILGPMMEEQLRRSMILSQGDPLIFVTRPLSATLLAVAVLALVLLAIPRARRSLEVPEQQVGWNRCASLPDCRKLSCALACYESGKAA